MGFLAKFRKWKPANERNPPPKSADPSSAQPSSQPPYAHLKRRWQKRKQSRKASGKVEQSPPQGPPALALTDSNFGDFDVPLPDAQGQSVHDQPLAAPVLPAVTPSSPAHLDASEDVQDHASTAVPAGTPLATSGTHPPLSHPLDPAPPDQHPVPVSSGSSSTPRATTESLQSPDCGSTLPETAHSAQHHPTAPSPSLPPDIWFTICEHLASANDRKSRGAIVAIMCTATWAYHAGARALYHTVEIGPDFHKVVADLRISLEHGGNGRRRCGRHGGWCLSDDASMAPSSMRGPIGKISLLTYTRTILVADVACPIISEATAHAIKHRLGKRVRSHSATAPEGPKVGTNDTADWTTNRDALFCGVVKVVVTPKGYLSLQDYTQGRFRGSNNHQPIQLHPLLGILLNEAKPLHVEMKYPTDEETGEHLMLDRYGPTVMDAVSRGTLSGFLRPLPVTVAPWHVRKYEESQTQWLAILTTTWRLQQVTLYTVSKLHDYSNINPSGLRIITVSRDTGEQVELSMSDLDFVGSQADQRRRNRLLP